MHGERESLVAKDSPRTTAGELQKIVESRGQKNLTKNGKHHLHHLIVVWEGFKKNYPRSSKNKLLFIYQTRLELQMGLAFIVR